MLVPLTKPDVFHFPKVRIHFRAVDPKTKKPWGKKLSIKDLSVLEEIGGQDAQTIKLLKLHEISSKKIKREKPLQLLFLMDTSCSMGYRSARRRRHQFKGRNCGSKRKLGRYIQQLLLRPWSKPKIKCRLYGQNTSTAPSRFDKAKAAAKTLIRFLYKRKQDIQIGVQFFDTLSILIDESRFFYAKDQAKLLKMLDDKEPINPADTPLYYALRKSLVTLEKMRRPGVDQAIILLTDGVDDTGKRSKLWVERDELLSAVRATKGRLRVYGVKLAYWGGRSERERRKQEQNAVDFMYHLTKMTKGVLVPAGNLVQLKELFKGMLFDGSYKIVAQSVRFAKNPGRILRGDLSYLLRYKLQKCSKTRPCKGGQICVKGICRIACTKKIKCAPGKVCKDFICQAKPPMPPYMKASTTPLGQIFLMLLGGCGCVFFLWLLGLIPLGGGGSGGGGGGAPRPNNPPPQEDANPPGKKRARFVVGD